jgi:putative hemolysin
MDTQNGLRDALFLLLLFLLNGFFSMSEMAVVSSRRARLRAKAEEGRKGYQKALKTSENPSSFLSTIQIWITLIGTLSGVFSGATIAKVFAAWISKIDFLARYADSISLGIVVVVVTFLSIIIGELVPKQLALSNPERIAAGVVGPVSVMAAIFRPIERLLSGTTVLILRLLRVDRAAEPAVTEEEIRIMIQEGTQNGVVGKKERDMVEGVFYLGDKRVSSFATHRSDIVSLELKDGPDEVKKAILAHPEMGEFVVCRESLDEPVGIVKARAALMAFLDGSYKGLGAIMEKPMFIPESMTALKAFEAFKANNVQTLLVLDEYGGMHGSLSQRDLVEEIVGELSMPGKQVDPEIVKRADGSYLVDGMTNIDTFRDFFSLERLLPESRDYNTLAGFILEIRGSIPRVGDKTEWEGYSFEVVDMDLHRIDKILVTPPPAP